MMPSEQQPSLHSRVGSIDLLRGIVMVIMALDHTRDFLHHDVAFYDPLDLAQTNIELFCTRWITHFCAPLFVFLAGTSAYLSISRGKSKHDVSTFLLTRGLWLIILELTIIRFGWTFNFDYVNDIFVQVIWVIGVSMIVLAGFIHLPLIFTTMFGIVMIALHNVFDGITVEHLGALGAIWAFLHVQTVVVLFNKIQMLVFYPLIPWIGVMAVGYSFGALVVMPPERRHRLFIRLGVGLTFAFIIIRAANVYGDPHPWAVQNSFSFTILSFLNTTKYPPSLQFLLMTIGPAMVLLPYLERWKNTVAQNLIIFGRVPMFYYIVHIYFIHILSGLLMFERYGTKAFTLNLKNLPPDFGFQLWVVYIIWIVVIVSLYPLCKWYADVKQRSNSLLLRYL